MWRKVLKWIRWLIAGIAGLALLITLLLLIFRKDIQNYALSQLDSYLTTKVYVYDIDIAFWKTFPNISIQFDKVLIKDEMIVEGTVPDTMIYAERVFLKLNTSDFWKGDYTVKSIDIDNARLGLRVNKEGKVNYDIIRSDSTSTGEAFRFVLDKVNIQNLDFTYDNYITQQHYQAHAQHLNFFGEFSEKSFDMRTAGDLFVRRIKSKSVALITNKNARFDVVLSIDKMNKVFRLEKSSVAIENLPFHVSGEIARDSIDFLLSGHNISLTDFAENFNQSGIDAIKKYQGSGNVNFTLGIHGPIALEQPPLTEARFTITNGSLKDPSGKVALKQVKLTGEFSNNYGKNEVLSLSELHFVTLNSSFDGTLLVENFSAPTIKTSMNGTVDLATLFHFFPISSIDHISGKVVADGQIHLKMNDPKRDPGNITLYSSRGDFDFSGIRMKIREDLPEISELSGKVSTSGDNAILSGITIRTGKSRIELSGSIRNIVAYFSEKANLSVDAVVDVRELYSADFYSNKNPQQETVSNPGAYLLPKNLNGKVILSIQKFYLDKHLFEDISSRFYINNRTYSASAIRFQHAGSTTNGSLEIREDKPSQIEVSGDLSASGIGFRELFSEWDNFEQKLITSDKISGIADVSLHFKLPFNLQKGLQKEKLEATADFTIKNGALRNVETFRSITASMRESNLVKTVLGKNIDALEAKLLNLTFSTLENKLSIREGKINIPEMAIRSNALDIDFSGWHTFDNDLDYRFDFRLRDLKFNKKSSEFGDVIDDGTGKRIFLHVYGSTSNLNFGWDAEANKEHRQEQREKEKETIKSMFKTEMGLFGKDTTIGEFTVKEKPQERLEVIFTNEEESNPEELPKEKKKMKKLFGMDLEKMREENQKEKETEFSIE